MATLCSIFKNIFRKLSRKFFKYLEKPFNISYDCHKNIPILNHLGQKFQTFLAVIRVEGAKNSGTLMFLNFLHILKRYFLHTSKTVLNIPKNIQSFVERPMLRAKGVVCACVVIVALTGR